uniref:Immediate early response 2b n=1 Tax=Lates calcarifer TaxID=8187 RepID=A0A4W6E8K0_LATCA
MEVNAEARRILAVSISKLYASRTQRGGLRLHRSLLLSLVMRSARDIYHSSRESEGPSGPQPTPEEPMDTSSSPVEQRLPAPWCDLCGRCECACRAGKALQRSTSREEGTEKQSEWSYRPESLRKKRRGTGCVTFRFPVIHLQLNESKQVTAADSKCVYV